MGILRLYGDCIVKTLKAIGKSPWTVLLPIAYYAVSTIIASLVAPLGIIGGFIMGFVTALLFASFLHVMNEMVRGSFVTLKEMPRSTRTYYVPALNFLFVYWVGSWLLGSFLSRAPNGGAILLAIEAVALIILNAVPEVIYQRGVYGGIDAIMGSIDFIQDQWIEWFLVNIPLCVGLIALIIFIGMIPFSFLLGPVIIGAYIHAMFVFRGFLFQGLDGTTRRQRAMRARLGR